MSLPPTASTGQGAVIESGQAAGGTVGRPGLFVPPVSGGHKLDNVILCFARAEGCAVRREREEEGERERERERERRERQRRGGRKKERERGGGGERRER